MYLKGAVNRIIDIIKISSYILGSTILLTNCEPKYFTFFAFAIAAIITNSFFREFYLYEKKALNIYAQISTCIELILITLISVFDNFNVIRVYFFASIFELTLIYRFSFGFLAVCVVMISQIIIQGLTAGLNFYIEFEMVKDSSIVVAFFVSYILKNQVIEKEKLRKMNGEIERAYMELLDNYTRVEELSGEKERIRISREIHDTLAHILTVVIIQLEVCKKLIDVDKDRATEEVQKAEELIREGLVEVKQTIKSLRPKEIENRSFFDVITNFINGVMDSTNININFENKTDCDLILSQVEKISLLRIIQESVTNSIRHGIANTVNIIIENENSWLIVHIKDNGRGCEYIKSGFGLKGISERAEELNGVVDYSSIPEKGFTTSIRIPLKGGGISAN